MQLAETARKSMWGLIVVVSIILAVQLYLWPHITDDAYISFRYVDRLVNGDGLTFNDGERVEGFSNPLWTIILAGIAKPTSLDIPDIARGLGLVCTVASIVLVWWGMTRILPECRLFSFIVAMTLIVMNPGVHVFATAGLEGPLFGCLLIGGIVATLSGKGNALYIAASLFALAGVTRPEGLMYGLFWLMTQLWIEPRLNLSTRHKVLLLVIVVTPALGWEIFRLLYYGFWLPNSAIAKPPGTFGGFLILPSYLQPWILSLGGPFTVLLWFFLKVEETSWYRRLLQASAGVIVANAVFLLYTRGDWMPFGRFIVPAWPVIAMLFGIWLDSALERLGSAGALRLKGSLAFVAIAGVVACSVFAWQVQVRSYVSNKEMNMQMRGTDQVAVGQWLTKHIRSGATVATPWLGGMSYVAKDLVFWDLAGLTDAEQAAYIDSGPSKDPSNDPILQRKPDVIAALNVPASFGYKNNQLLYEWISKRYTLVKAIPQGNFGAVDIWILSDQSREILRAYSQNNPS